MSRRSEKNNLDEDLKEGVGQAIGRIPSGVFILTARHEDRSLGMLASWVQQVSFDPPMVSVAVAKGRPIMPLISESRQFGLCQLPVGEKIITRKFAGSSDPGEDPFLGFDMIHDTVNHSPILAHVMSYLECEVTCHVDVEGDHDLFVGTIRGGRFLQGEPWIHLRDNGFKY
jgi:flavin reductase (DIM6/NTAB) family NADH-FMN oxidoreductase RutF